MPVNYAQLTGFFDILFVKIGTLLVLISISYHSLQGIHHIIEDYLTDARVGNAEAEVLDSWQDFNLLNRA